MILLRQCRFKCSLSTRDSSVLGLWVILLCPAWRYKITVRSNLSTPDATRLQNATKSITNHSQSEERVGGLFVCKLCLALSMKWKWKYVINLIENKTILMLFITNTQMYRLTHAIFIMEYSCLFTILFSFYLVWRSEIPLSLSLWLLKSLTLMFELKLRIYLRIYKARN